MVEQDLDSLTIPNMAWKNVPNHLFFKIVYNAINKFLENDPEDLEAKHIAILTDCKNNEHYFSDEYQEYSQEDSNENPNSFGHRVSKPKSKEENKESFSSSEPKFCKKCSFKLISRNHKNYSHPDVCDNCLNSDKVNQGYHQKYMNKK